jgi:hypothetical protein
LGASVTGTAVGSRAELGDGDRLSLCDEGADAFPEVVGDRGGPV